jgi:hypothetical protein
MISMIIPIAFVIIGGVLYLVATNPKFAELGKVLFAAGAFALAFALSGKTWSL